MVSADLTKQIKLNRNIAKLYKDYQKYTGSSNGRTSVGPTSRAHMTKTAMHRSAPPKTMKKDHSGGQINRLSLSTHPRKSVKKLLDQSSPDLRLQPPPNQSYITD